MSMKKIANVLNVIIYDHWQTIHQHLIAETLVNKYTVTDIKVLYPVCMHYSIYDL